MQIIKSTPLFTAVYLENSANSLHKFTEKEMNCYSFLHVGGEVASLLLASREMGPRPGLMCLCALG